MSSNRDGFGEDGIHRATGTEFGPDGYAKNGLDKNGFDMIGCNQKGGMRKSLDTLVFEMGRDD